MLWPRRASAPGRPDKFAMGIAVIDDHHPAGELKDPGQTNLGLAAELVIGCLELLACPLGMRRWRRPTSTGLPDDTEMRATFDFPHRRPERGAAFLEPKQLAFDMESHTDGGRIRG